MKTFSFPTLLVLPVIVLLTSCKPSVQFNEAMPPGRFDLPNIPRAYRGDIVDGEDIWRIGKDSIQMDDWVMVNGQDFVLRRMAGHLLMSQPVPETGHWVVTVIKRDGDQFRTGHFEDDDELLKRMAILMETEPEPKKSGGKPGYRYVLVSPTAKEFRAVLKEGLYELEDDSMTLPRGRRVMPPPPPPPTN